MGDIPLNDFYFLYVFSLLYYCGLMTAPAWGRNYSPLNKRVRKTYWL